MLMCKCGHEENKHKNYSNCIKTCFVKIENGNNRDFCPCDKFEEAKAPCDHRWYFSNMKQAYYCNLCGEPKVIDATPAPVEGKKWDSYYEQRKEVSGY